MLNALYDTTVTVLSDGLAYLTQTELKPELKKLYSEVSEIAETSMKITQKTLSNLPILDSVTKEILRMCNPVILHARKLNSPLKMKKQDKVVKIPFSESMNFDVLVLLGVMSRETDYFGQDSDKFRPSRWRERNEKGMFQSKVDKKYASVPFLTGPRSCMGRYFATYLIKVALIFLVGEFDMRCVESGLERKKLTAAELMVKFKEEPGIDFFVR